VLQSAVVDPLSVDASDAPGRGRLGVERRASRSVVTSAFATSPLRLLTPANHGDAAWVYTSNYGGGLVDGDRVVIDVEVGPGAAAFVSTQASTKVYRSPRGTSAELRARVGPDGLLIVAPDPVACFTGARYRQLQRFQVANTGALVLIDCVLSGRCAAGERWAFSEYRSLIEISVGDRLLVHDGLALRTSDGDLAKRLGRFDVLAVAVVVGRTLRDEAATLLAGASRSPVARGADQIIMASSLGEDGCILRLAGTSGEQAGRTLRELLRFIPERLGDDPWRRKW
jgi:urease accessory protein